METRRMTVAGDILVYGATRIGSAVGWLMRNVAPVIGALGAWAIVAAWIMTGGGRRD